MDRTIERTLYEYVQFLESVEPHFRYHLWDIPVILFLYRLVRRNRYDATVMVNIPWNHRLWQWNIRAGGSTCGYAYSISGEYGSTGEKRERSETYSVVYFFKV